MKDWTGNSKTAYSILGASNHSVIDREQNDYYATHPSAIDDLLLFEKFEGSIWECACGEGHLSKRLEDYNYKVISTDLINRKYGKGNIDFLKFNGVSLADNIITNPPYKYAEEFVEKALYLLQPGKKLAMFLKLTFLEGQDRYNLFKNYPPKTVYVYSNRKQCAMNGDFKNKNDSAIAYAWFVWVVSQYNETNIKWILSNSNKLINKVEIQKAIPKKKSIF